MDLSSTPVGTLARRWQWLLIAAIVGWLIYLLAPVLTPFVCAALLGWLGDPWVDRLERTGRSRTTSVVLVFTLMLLLLVLALLILVPMLERQIVTLVESLPEYRDWFVQKALPWVEQHTGLELVAWLDPDRIMEWLREALEALEGHDVVALDGLELIAGNREDEIALFDFHNRARPAGIRVLYTARDVPAEIGLELPDLRSRLSQCARIVLSPLEEQARREVLRERARRRGLSLDEASIDWLLRRRGRDLATLTGLLDVLDRASLAAQRRITVPFLREALGEK